MKSCKINKTIFFSNHKLGILRIILFFTNIFHTILFLITVLLKYPMFSKTSSHILMLTFQLTFICLKIPSREDSNISLIMNFWKIRTKVMLALYRLFITGTMIHYNINDLSVHAVLCQTPHTFNLTIHTRNTQMYFIKMWIPHSCLFHLETLFLHSMLVCTGSVVVWLQH